MAANPDTELRQGVKHDEGKLRYGLLSFFALKELTKVVTFGAQKYADRNWELGINYDRVYEAALRHLTAWWMREDKDQETGLSHLAHAMCCIMFLLHYSVFSCYRKFDNRPKPLALEGVQEEGRL